MRDNPTVKTVDDYIALLPEVQQLALEKLRQSIRTVAPQAEEVISYQIPMYKYYGHLVGFAAFKNHCSFFVTNSPVMETFRTELKPFKTAISTIQFLPQEPIPDDLVERILRQRMQENESRKAK